MILSIKYIPTNYKNKYKQNISVNKIIKFDNNFFNYY